MFSTLTSSNLALHHSANWISFSSLSTCLRETRWQETQLTAGWHFTVGTWPDISNPQLWMKKCGLDLSYSDWMKVDKWNQPPTGLLKKCQLAVCKRKRTKIRKEKRSGFVWEEKRYMQGLLGGIWVQSSTSDMVFQQCSVGNSISLKTMQGLFLVKFFTAVILTKHEICRKQTKRNGEYGENKPFIWEHLDFS